MTLCVMCKKEFELKDVDFLGRCTPCFKLYLDMEKKPKIGVPFVPNYHGGYRG